MKKKHSMSRFIVPFVIFSLFTFTGVAIWLQFAIGMELSPTLITCFYGFCTTEILALASIKKAKINSYDIDNDGIPDEEDTYIDPRYIEEMEEVLRKLKEKSNNGDGEL